MKNVLLPLFIILGICYLAIPASYAIKIKDPAIVNDGSSANSKETESVNDKSLEQYLENEPEETLKQEVKKNAWEAINDNHDYDEYGTQNYGGEGNDEGIDENGDNYNQDWENE